MYTVKSIYAVNINTQVSTQFYVCLNTIDLSYLTLVKTGPAGFQRKRLLSFSCIKFWEHLLTSENTLVFKNFQATKNFNPWAKKLYSIFNSLGFSYIAESNCSIKALLPNIKQRLIDQCTQEQSSKIYIYSSTKLKFYQHFYDCNCRSAYVDILRNKTERSIVCKIRLSAHNLAIERVYFRFTHQW